jgi:hypothetical protein
VFRNPPEGSTLAAIAKEVRDKEAATPPLTDPAVLRPLIVSSLLADGMPADARGKWLDGLIDDSVLLTRHALLLASTMRPVPSRDEPDVVLIAFTVGRFEAHRRRLRGAVHESADTSAARITERALIATAIEAGPGVNVANVGAAWLFHHRRASRSPAAARAFEVAIRCVGDLASARSPAGLWVTARDRKIALNAIDDQYVADVQRRLALDVRRAAAYQV